jgi:hypothetical protein
MSIQVNKYNTEKIKKIFNLKFFLFLLNLNNSCTNLLFKKFNVKTSFLRILIKASIFNRVSNLINSRILISYPSFEKMSSFSLKFKNSFLFMVLNNKIYSYNQVYNLNILKFTSSISRTNFMLNFSIHYKIITKFFKSL